MEKEKLCPLKRISGNEKIERVKCDEDACAWYGGEECAVISLKHIAAQLGIIDGTLYGNG